MPSDARLAKSKAREDGGPPPSPSVDVGISRPLSSTRLYSGPKPRTVTNEPSPFARSIDTPVMRCSNSARLVSGNLPISSAEMASTTPCAFRLMSIDSRRDARMPVMTMSSPLTAFAGASAAVALAVVGRCSSVCWAWSTGGGVCACATPGAIKAIVEPLASQRNIKFLREADMPPLSPVRRAHLLADAFPLITMLQCERSLCQARIGSAAEKSALCARCATGAILVRTALSLPPADHRLGQMRWHLPAMAILIAQASAGHGMAWPNGARAAIVLTYDDAVPSQLDHAIPALEFGGIERHIFPQQSASGRRRTMESRRGVRP